MKAIVASRWMMARHRLKGAVEGMLAAWDRAPVKKPLVTGFAVGAIAGARDDGGRGAQRCAAHGGIT